MIRKLKTIEIERLSVEEFQKSKKIPLIVVLDDVRSLYNVGSVFRTSDAFAVEAVYLCGITAQPPSAEIHKTALGAENSVAWRYFKTTEEAVDALHSQGYTVCAIEQCEGSIKLDNAFKLQNIKTSPPSGGFFLHYRSESQQAGAGWALVLGNEVKGVKQSVIDKCDCCLEIPQYGTKHSMNVSVTAGIVIWEFSKQLQQSPERAK